MPRRSDGSSHAREDPSAELAGRARAELLVDRGRIRPGSREDVRDSGVVKEGQEDVLRPDLGGSELLGVRKGRLERPARTVVERDQRRDDGDRRRQRRDHGGPQSLQVGVRRERLRRGRVGSIEEPEHEVGGADVVVTRRTSQLLGTHDRVPRLGRELTEPAGGIEGGLLCRA